MSLSGLVFPSIEIKKKTPQKKKGKPLLVLLGFYRVLPFFQSGFTRLCLSFTGFYWVLLGSTGFYWVSLGFTGFYWVLLDFTGFYWVLLGFTGFY